MVSFLTFSWQFGSVNTKKKSCVDINVELTTALKWVWQALMWQAEIQFLPYVMSHDCDPPKLQLLIWMWLMMGIEIIIGIRMRTRDNNNRMTTMMGTRMTTTPVPTPAAASNCWQGGKWMTMAPSHFCVGGLSLISLHSLTDPLPCTPLQGRGVSCFFYCTTYMLAHRPLPVMSFFLTVLISI